MWSWSVTFTQKVNAIPITMLGKLHKDLMPTYSVQVLLINNSNVQRVGTVILLRKNSEGNKQQESTMTIGLTTCWAQNNCSINASK